MMTFPIDLKMLSMALAVVVSSNLDNIAIGTSISFRRIDLRFRDNVVVAIVTTIGTLISAAAGSALTQIIPDSAESAIGGAIMLLVGLWIIYQEIAKPKPADAATGARQADGSVADGVPVSFGQTAASANHVRPSELLMLSLGLTLNNIPNGVGAGILHIDIWLLASMNFLASLLTLALGLQVGRRGVHWLGRYAGYIAGLVLAALGATEMVF